MKSETMLPLGKVDPGLREPDTPLDVRTIAEGAEQIEFLGYDGIAVEECKDDPYQQLTLASVNTNELELATSKRWHFRDHQRSLLCLLDPAEGVIWPTNSGAPASARAYKRRYVRNGPHLPADAHASWR